MKEQKSSSKTTDIVNVSYALEVSVNDVTCVFVVHFRASDTFSRTFVNWLNSYIHVSTKTCVTGNNLVLHTALPTPQDLQTASLIRFYLLIQ